jgi:putative hemolysin
MNFKWLKTFRQRVDEVTLEEASHELLASVGFTVTKKGSTPKKGPTLFVCNHPTGLLDLFLVMSTCDREDLHVVGLASYGDLSPRLARHLFPIYRKKKKRDTALNLLIKGLQSHIKDDVEETRKLNRQSITMAAKHVDTGGAVVIFPTGTGGKKSGEGNWKPGVGFLAKQLDNDANVVYVHVPENIKHDILRFLHPRLVKLFFKPKKIHVSYSKAVKLNTVCDLDSDGKTIARQLEKKYTEVFGR